MPCQEQDQKSTSTEANNNFQYDDMDNQID